MKTAPQFKILPVLILVSMLTFSVRLVDLASGFSSLSGSAFAEGAKQDHAQGVESPEMPDSAALEEVSEGGDAHHDKAVEHDGEHAAADDRGDKAGSWLDSGEDEIEYSAITYEVFEDLVARRKQLDAREKELMTREALLRATEQELDRKFQELSTLRDEITGLLDQQSEEEKARIQSLVKIYENMKPKDAARIFDTLDLDILVSVMGQMSERRLSPILAGMNPERARTITIMLAEEKQLPELPR